jgi:3-oxoadipate enol-lactonase
MKALQWETRQVRLAPDLELPYHVVGNGLPVLLANGLGGPRQIWEELVAHAKSHYRFITWDYRGLHARPHIAQTSLHASSEAAHGARLNQAHGVPAHARDALAILEAEAISRCAVVGWSMGVAVSLELFSQAPSRIGSLTMLCGGTRAAWAPGPARSLPALVLLRALQLARRNPRASRLLLKMSLQSPEAFTWARRLGLLGEQFSPDAFARIVSELLDLDLPSYVDTWDRLAEHDASAVLSQVDVPALVIGGGHDPFTVRAGLEELAQGIAGAEYLFLPEGTHYLLLDHAERVNLRVEKFWNERGYAAP